MDNNYNQQSEFAVNDKKKKTPFTKRRIIIAAITAAALAAAVTIKCVQHRRLAGYASKGKTTRERCPLKVFPFDNPFSLTPLQPPLRCLRLAFRSLRRARLFLTEPLLLACRWTLPNTRSHLGLNIFISRLLLMIHYKLNY